MFVIKTGVNLLMEEFERKGKASKEDLVIEPLIDYLKKNTDLNFLKITPSHLKALKNHISAQEITKNNINDLSEISLKNDIISIPQNIIYHYKDNNQIFDLKKYL
jgi:Asp-tRNA(Asn)/Glu-tRNA(Gln) amidotransferase B subunit